MKSCLMYLALGFLMCQRAGSPGVAFYKSPHLSLLVPGIGEFGS